MSQRGAAVANKEPPITRAIRKAARGLNRIADQLEFALVRFKGDRSDINFNIDLTQETVWSTQAQMAELFDVDRSVITKHVKNIFESKELDENRVCAEFAHTGPDGKTYQVKNYNLDVILSVGYRVSSTKATAFRQWATKTLRSYVVDGYAINEARLRDDPAALKKLAAKVRALRADEKNIYAAVRECFKISASDYDKASQETRSFYARLQDKFHYAVAGMTASQVILDRADHRQPDMGLKTMNGKIPALTDATVAKNYLDSDELYALHLLCEQFLLYAESKALRGQKMTMKELARKLDALMETNEYPVFKEYKDYLKDRAIQHAQTELALYLRQFNKGKPPSKLN
jgi:hypothetical protein